MDPDNNDFVFARARALIEQADADVVVMLVGDYMPRDDDNNDKLNTCGHAPDRMVVSSDTAFGAVESVCIAAQSFTHVIGLMQGAGPNIEQGTNSEFSYGHGYYHAGADMRTIMSQSAGNCNDPRTPEEEVCHREQIWSDPYRVFFGTGTPAGTPDNWNARVVFATAPHIASLNGPAQSYDSVTPTGSIDLPSPLPSRGTLDITATFSESIHEWFPPIITITDGIETTTALMTKSSETEYTYPHMLDGESGMVHLLFSNARDVFGNPVDKNPVSGGTFLITAESVTPPFLPQGAVTSISDAFDSGLSMWNLGLPGNGDWTTTNPTEGVPDTPQATNRVIASNDCDDSCTATLKRTLNTLEPLVISFDRYVDKKVTRDEGLHVEYSVDGGTTWITLASYTQENDGDTRRWEKTVLGLSIPESSAQFRFHAKSDRVEEYVEVDNLRIFRPSDAAPDATFSATLNRNLTHIILLFSHTISQDFLPSSFTLSHGSVTGVSGSDTNTRILNVIDVPYDTRVSVTYVGDAISIDGDTYLVNGTVGITNVVTSQHDSTAPVITVPADMIVEAEGQYTVVDIGTANVTDNTDLNPAISNNAPSSFLVETTVITWTATDSSGNSATATQRITVRDTTPPDITAPPDASFTTIDTSIVLTSADYGTANATDLVDSAPTITSNAPPSFQAGETTTITWTATDDYFNSAHATQRITVISSPSPSSLMIFAPPDITVEASEVHNTVNIGAATATHDTDTNIIITNDAPSSFRVGTTTVITWTATDSSGNSATATQRITVRDTTPPDITAPPDASFTTIDTSIVLTSADYGTANATDLVDSAPTITSNAPPSFQAGETTTITWTATDDYFNSAHATQRITVISSPSPSSLMIFAPPDITVEASEVHNTVNIGAATATHDTDTNIIITNDAPSSFRVGTITVITWTATDSTGVIVTATQTVTVQDTTDPTFDPVQDLDFVFEPDVPLIIYYDSPTATDSVDGSVDVTCTPASGTVFVEGMTEVTCTATDNSVNTASLTFSVDVTVGVDVTVVDSNIFLDTFEDGNMDGWKSISWDSFWLVEQITESAYPPNHPDTNKALVAELCFSEGGCIISLTAGINLTGSNDPMLQFYRYVHPSLDAGEFLSVEAYDGSTWRNLDIWTPEDSDNDGTWHLEEYSLASYANVDDFNVRFVSNANAYQEEVAVDDVRIFQVPLQNATGPVFGTVLDLDFVFDSGTPLVVNYNSPTATDSAGSLLEVTCTPSSDSVFVVGTTEVTCTATDGSDNSASVTFDVNVSIAAPVDNSILLFDDFEDGNLDGWDVPGSYVTWSAVLLDENVYPPDHADTNKVAQATFCDVECTMTSIDIDLTGHDSATLQFYRYVDDSLDNTEYLKVEVYDGSVWVQLDIWTPENFDDDDTWHLEEYSLSEYAGIADFKVRFSAFMSSFIEVTGIDDVKVFVQPTS